MFLPLWQNKKTYTNPETKSRHIFPQLCLLFLYKGRSPYPAYLLEEIMSSAVPVSLLPLSIKFTNTWLPLLSPLFSSDSFLFFLCAVFPSLLQNIIKKGRAIQYVLPFSCPHILTRRLKHMLSQFILKILLTIKEPYWGAGLPYRLPLSVLQFFPSQCLCRR